MRTRNFLAGAAAAALTLMPNAASAAGPYDVSVGSTTAGPVPYTATSTGPVAFSAPLINFSCTSHTMSGDVHAGKEASGTNVMSVLNAWHGCLGPLHLPLTFAPSGTWQVDAVGDATGNQVAVELTNITFVVYQTSAPGNCMFTVTGSMSGYLDKTTQQIVISETDFTGDLTISNRIGGCYGGLVANGQPLNYAGTLNLDTQGAGAVDVRPSA